jgi:hypothetical protein
MRNLAFLLTRTWNLLINGNYTSAFVYMTRKFSVVIYFQNPPRNYWSEVLPSSSTQALEALEGRQTVAFLSVDGALIHVGANEGWHIYWLARISQLFWGIPVGYRKYVPYRGTSGSRLLFFGTSDDFNIGVMVFSAACHWPTECCTQCGCVQVTSGAHSKYPPPVGGEGVAELHPPNRNFKNSDFVNTKNQTFHLIQRKSATEIIWWIVH